MITVFIIACGEGWNEVWVDTSVAVGGASYLYFVALVVLRVHVIFRNI